MPGEHLVTLSGARPVRGSKRRSLTIDGEHWRWVSADVVREIGLGAEDSMDLDLLEQRLGQVEPRLARERALRLLNARERTSAEVTRRLVDDGFDAYVAAETVAVLVDSGLIDDERFARVAARTLIEIRDLGRSRALRELIRQGLPEALAVSALEELAPAVNERERAKTAAGQLARSRDTVARLASRLVRRGFSPSDAFAAARDTLPDQQEANASDNW